MILCSLIGLCEVGKGGEIDCRSSTSEDVAIPRTIFVVLVLTGFAMTSVAISPAAQAQQTGMEGRQVRIVLNGEPSQLESGTTVSGLVEGLGREPASVDVQYNGRFLHRDEYGDIVLRDGDQVEIVDRVQKVDTDRFAIALAFGLVNLNEEALDDDVEPYFGVSLRIGMGGDAGNDWSERRASSGWNGYLEGELGYWERSDDSSSGSDLLLGINLVGVTSVGVADFFIGGGIGLHFADQDLTLDGESLSTSEEAIGVNAQFGVDLNMTRNVSVFFTGRFDIIEDRDALEAKAYVGVRLGF